MALVGGTRDEGWSNASLVRTRYKWTQSSVWLNLADTHERVVYFCGRYYDLAPQLALQKILRPGDTFVDIGANIGLMTVLASQVVGVTGVIYAIEPNPECSERLSLHVTRNGLTQVRVHRLGFSDQDDILSLTYATESSVHGSFAPAPDEAAVKTRHLVTVRRGDDILSDAPRDRPMVIKIDVEGFECRVLRGLAATIGRHKPVVVVEVVAEHLARAGSSVAELFDLMHGFGYSGAALTMIGRWGRYRLRLVPVTIAKAMPDFSTDVLWTPSHAR